MNDDRPLDGVPDRLHAEIIRLWDERVRGGAQRYQERRDGSGGSGQRTISTLLKRNGVLPKTDGRYERVIAYGQALYKEPMGAERGSSSLPESSASVGADQGPVYTRGETFRARAEAAQRRYRAYRLGVGHGTWGHLLDAPSRDQGCNFLHPDALASVEARIALGKGVHRERTYGNLLSSQAMAFNLLGPLAYSAEGLSIATALLKPWVDGLAEVLELVIEHTPDSGVFRDQSGHGGVDCDVLVEYLATDGLRGVLVIETKYVEPEFSTCGHRKSRARRPCPPEVQLGEDFSGCRYHSSNGYRYWTRTRDLDTLDLALVREQGCPFGGSAWQLWVNHTLAHVEACRRGARYARLAICAPADNDALLRGGDALGQLRRYLRDPSTLLFLPLEELIRNLGSVCQGREVSWRRWAAELAERYTAAFEGSPPVETPAFAATKGYRAVVDWLGSQDFAALHRVVLETLGPGSLLFRPTDKGVVVLSLHPRAPKFVGFRRSQEDGGWLLRPGAPGPHPADLRVRWEAHEAYVSTLGPRCACQPTTVKQPRTPSWGARDSRGVAVRPR